MPPFTYTPPNPDQPLTYGPPILQAPEVRAPAAREMDIAPRPLQAPAYNQDMLGNVLRAAAEAVASSSLTRDEGVRNAVLGMVRNQRAQIEQDRISREMDFVTGHLMTALSGGDPAEAANALKQLGGLNLHPDVAKRFQDLSLNLAQSLGQSMSFNKALRSLPPHVTREEAARIFAEANVNPALTDAFLKTLPEAATNKPMAVGRGGLAQFNPQSGKYEMIPGTVPAPPFKPIAVGEQITVYQTIQSLKEAGQPMPPELTASLQVGPMEHDRASKILKNIIQSETNKHLAEQEQLKRQAIEISRAAQAEDVIPQRFIDPSGKTIPNVTKGQWSDPNWRKQTGAIQLVKGSSMEKQWDAASLVKEHYDAYLPSLSALSSDVNKLRAYLKTEVSVLENDPVFGGALQALGAVSPFALAAGWTSTGGAGMRGGAIAARMTKPAVWQPSDTLQTMVSKSKTMLSVIARKNRDAGLPSSPITGIIDKYEKVLTGKYEAILLPSGEIGLRPRR